MNRLLSRLGLPAKKLLACIYDDTVHRLSILVVADTVSVVTVLAVTVSVVTVSVVTVSAVMVSVVTVSVVTVSVAMYKFAMIMVWKVLTLDLTPIISIMDH